MPRIFCIDCAIPVVVDPQGRCPEGHVLDGSAPDSNRDEEITAADNGPDAPNDLDLFDELRDLDGTGFGSTASDADSTAAAPAGTGSAEATPDELERERGTPQGTSQESSASGDDLAFLFEPAASTPQTDAPPDRDDDPTERTQPISISSATDHDDAPVPSPARSDRIDPTNFTSRGGRVGDVHAAAGGWRSRFTRRRVS